MGLNFDYIFLATGTGATQSGLIAGKVSSHGKENIIGVSVARSESVETEIINGYLHSYFDSDSNETTYYDHIKILDTHINSGYGNGDKEILHNIKNMLVENGIPLDITYTGKAYTGMLDYLRNNNISDKNILFIHTGGTPLFFNDLDKICEGTI